LFETNFSGLNTILGAQNCLGCTARECPRG